MVPTGGDMTLLHSTTGVADVDSWDGWLTDQEGSKYQMCLTDFSTKIPDPDTCTWVT